MKPVVEFLHPRRAYYAVTKQTSGFVPGSRSRQNPQGGALSDGHCSIRLKQGVVVIRDTTGRNGTYVNGVKVDEAELHVGDVVRIGEWVGVLCGGTSTARDVEEVHPGLLAGPVLRSLLVTAERIAESRLPVMILGESGTGKELVARFIHDKSGRDGSFVALNCAALPLELAEAELFGHERGAFTGAEKSRLGAFRSAHRGTLLLDEVGELPVVIQAKLLRVLEDGRVRALGAEREAKIDVRVVVAGHDSLQQLVRERRFRGDLLARLNGIELSLPPLRERREEVPDLFVHAFEAFAGFRPRLGSEVVEALLLYEWPFNAREVRQLAHRAAALRVSARTRRLTLDDLPAELFPELRRYGRPGISGSSPAPPATDLGLLRRSRHQDQLAGLRRELEASAGNVSRAARTLGISRGRAYRLISGTPSARNRSSN